MPPLPSDSKQENVPLQKNYRGLPVGIWTLGFVSMFMDISSELVHSLLPIFMTTVLGASMLTVGLVEGVVEATAAITKVFSGVISDYFRKRKFLVVFGYGLSALTKPMFPMASSMGWVFLARFIDRIGKGIRGAPRDALIGDMISPHLRGAAYGLRQSLDSTGAFIGPLLAVLLMLWLNNDIKTVLWVAVLPAWLAVIILALGVRDPKPDTQIAMAPKLVFNKDTLKKLSPAYWLVVALGVTFTLARFSEAFLILRAQNLGLEIAYAPVILIVMNIIYSLFAYPAGKATDRVSIRTLLVFGLAMLVLADVVLATATSVAWIFVGAMLWGLHMAFSQGLLLKLVADTAPAELLGTAFGIFNLMMGLALLLASVLAGALWANWGPGATFFAGAIFAALAALGLVFYRQKHLN
ncbi:MAG TPA: MFS transporter [Pseudomonadales bacterium]|nr:MFS transporter [Pseudomonadales bacterium]